MRLLTGALDQQVTFQSHTAATNDTIGGGAITPANIATNPTVWAHVEPLSAVEGIKTDAITSLGQYRVTVRHRTDLNATITMLWNGVDHNIRHIDQSKRRDGWTVLDCEQVQS